MKDLRIAQALKKKVFVLQRIQVLGVVFLFLFSCSTPYQEPALALIPEEAQMFGVIDVDGFRRSKLWEAWEPQIQERFPFALGSIAIASSFLSIQFPNDLQSISVALWFDPKPQRLVVVSLKKPLDEETLFSLAKKYLTAKEEEQNGKRILRVEKNDISVAYLEKHQMVVIGTSLAMKRALALQDGAGNSVTNKPLLKTLQKTLPRGGEIWGVIEVPLSLQQDIGSVLSNEKFLQENFSGFANLSFLKDLQSFIGVIDVSEGILSEFRLQVSSEESAKKLNNSSEFLLSGFGMFSVFSSLPNFGKWLSFTTEENNWIIKSAVPQKDANRLLRYLDLPDAVMPSFQ